MGGGKGSTRSNLKPDQNSSQEVLKNENDDFGSVL